MHDLYHWIALRLVAGLGNVTCKSLLEQFGSAENIFAASHAALARVEGVGPQTAQAIRAFKHSDAIDREIERIESLGIRAVTYASAEYPNNLKEIYDPPALLYCRGRLLPGDSAAVAVVGSRSASDYGRRAAGDICRELSRAGLVLVSGMARGIDSIAHGAALAAGGRTIAVLGSGVDVVYPPENRKLYEKIADNGAVVSEYALGTEPSSYHFPARNRIISGISRGVLVVEAGMKSGSLITARVAADQGREVFAVPGSIYSFKTKGAHALIRSGAKLVENAADILEELNVERRPAAAKDAEELAPELRIIYSILEEKPVHIDDLILRLKMAPGKLLPLLLELELSGYVQQLPGKRFAKMRA